MSRSRTTVPFRYIVCTDKSGIIGVKNQLPFHVPLDMARFKSCTEQTTQTDSTTNANVQNGVLMGYSTWKSLPSSYRPLPNRLNLVLTRTPDHAQKVREEGGYPFNNITLMLNFVEEIHKSLEAVYVIGGGTIYNHPTLQEYAQTVHWTMVDAHAVMDGCGTNSEDIVRFSVPDFISTRSSSHVFEMIDSWSTKTDVKRHFVHSTTTAVDSAVEQIPVVFRTYRRKHDDATHDQPSTTLSIQHARPLERNPSPTHLSHSAFYSATQNVSGEVQYLRLLRKVLCTADKRQTRNSITRSSFGERLVIDLSDGTVPLLTSKKMAWKTVLRELFWFVRGDTDNAKLQAENVHIWDANASREFLDSRGLTDRPVNDLGPVYGFQWRHFGADYVDCHTDYSGRGVDQLEECRRLICEDPHSRRILFTAWNPSALSQMALPPCHLLGQWYVKDDGRLWLQLYQRSGDLFLGVPFNMFSYSALVHMMAHLTGKLPGGLVHIIGDAHIYEEHIGVVEEQLERNVHPAPTFRVKCDCNATSWEEFDMNSVELKNYVSEGGLRAPMIA